MNHDTNSCCEKVHRIGLSKPVQIRSKNRNSDYSNCAERSMISSHSLNSMTRKLQTIRKCDDNFFLLYLGSNGRDIHPCLFENATRLQNAGNTTAFTSIGAIPDIFVEFRSVYVDN